MAGREEEPVHVPALELVSESGWGEELEQVTMAGKAREHEVAPPSPGTVLMRIGVEPFVPEG